MDMFFERLGLPCGYRYTGNKAQLDAIRLGDRLKGAMTFTVLAAEPTASSFPSGPPLHPKIPALEH